MLGAVQFIATLANGCVLQGSNKFKDLTALLSGFEMFNLRMPIPKPLQQLPFLSVLSSCGQPPVDLVGQARADIGTLFAGNVFFGLIAFVLVFGAHSVLLLATNPDARFGRVVRERYPFPKVEFYAILIAFQGLVVSSMQMASLPLSRDEMDSAPVCAAAGIAMFLVPTGLMLFVIYVLFWHGNT